LRAGGDDFLLRVPKQILVDLHQEGCTVHGKKHVRNSWIRFDQTSLGLGPGKLFPAMESLVSDIPVGDGNTAKPFLQCAKNLSVKKLPDIQLA